MPEKLLSGEHHKQCVKGSRFLSSFDRDWELLISSVGPCRLNISLELEPYQALIKSVIYQQLRPTTASTILNKLKKNFDNHFPTASQILRCSEEKSLACGISSNKLKTIIEISSQYESGNFISQKEIKKLENMEIIDKLVAIKGIGNWTAQMLMIFNLGKIDIFPLTDFSLNKHYAIFKKTPLPLSVAQLAKPSSQWKPYRSVAAWYLWHYK